MICLLNKTTQEQCSVSINVIYASDGVCRTDTSQAVEVNRICQHHLHHLHSAVAVHPLNFIHMCAVDEIKMHTLTCVCYAECSALQGARTCYFSSVERTEGKLQEAGHHESASNMPASSLFALESIIQQRVQQHTQDTGEVPQHLQTSFCACAAVPKAQASGGHSITEHFCAPALCIHYHGLWGC